MIALGVVGMARAHLFIKLYVAFYICCAKMTTELHYDAGYQKKGIRNVTRMYNIKRELLYNSNNSTSRQ